MSNWLERIQRPALKRADELGDNEEIRQMARRVAMLSYFGNNIEDQITGRVQREKVPHHTMSDLVDGFVNWLSALVRLNNQLEQRRITQEETNTTVFEDGQDDIHQ